MVTAEWCLARQSVHKVTAGLCLVRQSVQVVTVGWCFVRQSVHGYSRMVLCQSDVCYEKTYGRAVTAGLVGDVGCAPRYLLLRGHLKGLFYETKDYVYLQFLQHVDMYRTGQGSERVCQNTVQCNSSTTIGQTMKPLHNAASTKNGTELHK